MCTIRSPWWLLSCLYGSFRVLGLGHVVTTGGSSSGLLYCWCTAAILLVYRCAPAYTGRTLTPACGVTAAWDGCRTLARGHHGARMAHMMQQPCVPTYLPMNKNIKNKARKGELEIDIDVQHAARARAEYAERCVGHAPAACCSRPLAACCWRTT